MAGRDDWLDLGRLAGPWGVQGEVKARIEPGLDFARQLKRIYVGPDRHPYAVAGVYQRGRAIGLKLRGVNSIAEAEKLRGLAISVPRAEAPPLPAGHYFHDDVIGLRVLTTSGRDLGTVADIIATGANDVYVVRSEHGDILVPAIQGVVLSIDPAAGLMRVEPMPGLLPDE